jgi:diaminohydroxyphosphoribosylaminopyrimidine deaminase/5-amino-6-(5-phosphoribosylamino)uracil reductase
LIVCSTKASPVAEEILQDKGVRVFRVDEQNGKLDLAQVMTALAGEGITRLMVEGGPRVAASLVSADLVDEAVLLNGPMTIGQEGIDPLEGMTLDALTGSMTLTEEEQIGPDRLVRYERV